MAPSSVLRRPPCPISSHRRMTIVKARDSMAAEGQPSGSGRPAEDAQSVASAEGPRPPKRKATNTKVEKDEAGEKNGSQKRRRRVFSCQSCQRLKCRCEYDPGSQACHRCVTLRIECSLKGEILDIPAHPKTVENATSIEERLGRHEKSLAEIKGMIEFVSRQFGLVGAGDIQKIKGSDGEAATDSPDSAEEDDSPENIADPVDLGIKSAPTVVLREIGEHVTQGYRRLEHVKLDLVQLQLLNEQTANELTRLFLRHHGHLLSVYDTAETPSRDVRELSAFLHSVCCLCAILYREDLCGTPMHRQVYEQVRITLGQALLSSPLNLEEINAILVMSDHADGPEYIDSWLLTGYCVKQAMLSISFSKIVGNIRRGSSTIQDRRAIHLWSTICLHHLHWSATTGRPSVLHIPYINQCNVLLSFYQASMQDGMLVAEILLYSVLHQKLSRRSYLDANGECDGFKAWKQKWNHLMSLSTASMLRIGYYAAYLILATRALEERGDAMSPKTFLSNPPFGSPANSTSNASDSRNSKNSTQMLQGHTSRYAHSVLETFVEMPAFLMDTIPTYLCLVIGYSALILAHYDETQSKVSAEVSLGLISRLEEWCMRTPSKSWAIKFATLARQKVESRTGATKLHPEVRKATSVEQDRRHPPAWSASDVPVPGFPVNGEHGTTPSSLSDHRAFEGDDFVSAPDTFHIASDPLHMGYEIPQPVIPIVGTESKPEFCANSTRMARMNALVIGANGYIGSAVCRAFVKAGYQVFGLIRRPEAMETLAANETIPVVGSLSDPKLLEDKLFDHSKTWDVIVGCAEPPDYASHIQEALVVLRRIAEVSNSNNVRPLVLWSSGCKDYGATAVDGAPDLAPHTESSPLNPPGVVISRATDSLKMLQQTDLFDAAVLRPTNVYGHSSSYYASIFQYAAAAAASGERKLTLKNIDQRSIMHSMHVDDCGEAYVALAEHADRSAVGGECFNISAYKYETAEMVLTALAKEYGFPEGAAFITATDPAELNDGMGPIFGFSQWVGSDKIRSMTGWSDHRMLFSVNLGVYRRSYEAAVNANHEDLARVKARLEVWQAEIWQTT
ncbi:C6 zinc finger domain protein [Seiridium cupressi]